MIKKPKYKCTVMLQNDLRNPYLGDINIRYFSYNIEYDIICVGIIRIYQIQQKHYIIVAPTYTGPSKVMIKKPKYRCRVMLPNEM